MLEESKVYDLLQPGDFEMLVTNVKKRTLTNPMLRKRFLVDGFGSVKKFQSLTNDNSERESREKREEAEGEDLRDGLDKETSCPGKSKMSEYKYI